MRSKMLNEKFMILCLLLLSILTVFIILNNLPSDIQRTYKQESLLMQKVFIPESGINLKINHNENHKHHSIPLKEKIFNEDIKKVEDFDILPSEFEQNTLEDKRNTIKKVTLTALIIFNCVNVFWQFRWLYLDGKCMKNMHGVKTN